MQEFPLTAAGRELSVIVDSKINIEIIKEICQIAAKKNSMINFSLHKVNYREVDHINYENASIDFSESSKAEKT